MRRKLQNIDRAYIVQRISQRDVLLKVYTDHAISRHPPVIHCTLSPRCRLDQEYTKWLSKTNEPSCSRLSVHWRHTHRSREGRRFRLKKRRGIVVDALVIDIFTVHVRQARVVARHRPRIRHFAWLRAPGECPTRGERDTEHLSERSYLVLISTISKARVSAR